MCNDNNNDNNNNGNGETGNEVDDDGDIAMDGDDDGEGDSGTMTMTTLRQDATTRTISGSRPQSCHKIWFVSSCCPGSARSNHLHGFDGLWIHPYNYSLYRKVLTHFIYI